MAENIDSDKDWYIDCSDDERYEGKDEELKYWLPPPSEIQHMFETLEKSHVLDISWQCPGRKHPSTDESNTLADVEEEEAIVPECTDFDFSSDETAAPNKLRRSEELRGSARKKTTSLDSVLSNMRRHRRIEESENQKASKPS